MDRVTNRTPLKTSPKPARRWRGVACDLDGTLLRSDATVSAHTCDVLRRLKDDGVVVMLASGRPPGSVQAIARSAGLSGPMVASNGAVTFDTDGRVIARELMPEGAIDYILDLCAPHDEVHWAIHCGFDWMTTELRPAFRGELEAIGRPPLIVDADAARRTEVDKIILNGPTDSLSAIGHELAAQGYVTFFPGWLEVMAPGITKLTGVRRVAEHFGFKVDDVVAFGDHDNDPAMLAGCGLGVAMGHASEAALAAADRVIGSNEDDAVAHFLAHELLGDASEPFLSVERD